MSQTNPLEEIKIESVFHPSDFSEASEVAFAHALRMALMAGAKLSMLQIAVDLAADLIAMTTDGPDGFLDGLRGTTSERVLRKARCPVANLPVGSMLD